MAEHGTTTDGSPAGSGGLLHSVRALVDNVLASAQQRLELLALELREEKLRAVQLLIWLSAAVFAAVLSLVFGSLTLVYLFWETARLQVLLGLTAFYAIGCVVAVRGFRRCFHQMPRPFEGTLAELRSDRACIPPTS